MCVCGCVCVCVCVRLYVCVCVWGGRGEGGGAWPVLLLHDNGTQVDRDTLLALCPVIVAPAAGKASQRPLKEVWRSALILSEERESQPARTHAHTHTSLDHNI